MVRLKPMHSLNPRIEPARFRIDENGTPVSETFGDVYFSKLGGLEESMHVFLQGNALFDRWRSRFSNNEGGHFTIAETGFGTGLNFLITAKEWTERVKKGHLSFYSCEKFPLLRGDFERVASNWPTLQPFARELARRYPLPVAGMHPICFPEWRITLNLYLGDVTEFLEGLVPSIDAWFCDGFTPARNPDMWAPRVAQRIYETTSDDGTFATFTVARSVKDSFKQSGFTLEKRDGFGRKREMLVGRKVSSGELTPPRSSPFLLLPQLPFPRSVAVIGAGLAGCAIAKELSLRNVRVTLFEKSDDICNGASGNPVGIYMPYLAAKETEISAYALSALAFLERMLDTHPERDRIAYARTGVARVLPSIEHIERLLEGARVRGFEQALLDPWTDNPFKNAVGFDVDGPSVRLKPAGWLVPRSLADADLEVARASRTGFELKFNCPTDAIERAFNDPQYDAVVVAAAWESVSFPGYENMPLAPLRGQIAWLDPCALSEYRGIPVAHDGTLARAPDGRLCIGASFEQKRRDLTIDPAVTDGLIQALESLTGQKIPRDFAAGARVSFRAVTADKLPIVGPIVDHELYRRRYHRLLVGKNRAREAPFAEGRGALLPGRYVLSGFGSRGICYIPLAAHTLTQMIVGEPLSLPRATLERLHPVRFLARELRRTPLPRGAP